ncbi:MAG: hypothetical protein FD174_1087 [Geobacteraceae bacterium]|nr:MAG: hypothetical protein FD174_1087 [Geobacteraceae bacterium]
MCAIAGSIFVLTVGISAAHAGVNNIWTSNGPYGAVVNTLAASSSAVYAGTNGGGIYKSTDDGATWSATNSGLTATTITALAIDPLTPATVFAGTNGGVFKSTNGGTSWIAVNSGLTNTNVSALAIDPSTPATIYVGIDGGGVFKSTSGGTNWSPVNSGLSSLYVRTLAIDPLTPATIYAGVNGGGVFKSTTGGANWSVNNSGLTDLTVRTLAIDPVTPATVYAGTHGGGIFKSINGGTDWNTVDIGVPGAKISSLAIDPAAPLVIYAGTSGGGIYKSTDGGSTWSSVNSGLSNATINTLAIKPSASAIIYAGTGGGVCKTADSGASWSALNAGNSQMFYTDIRAIVIDPADRTNIYAGLDGGGVCKTTDSGANWSPASSGLTNTTVNSLAFISTAIYAGTNGNGIFKSTDGGVSWAATGFTNAVVRAIAFHSSAPLIIYAGTGGGVFKSTDGGTNWGAVNTGLLNLDVRALAIDPSASNTVYAGTGGGVFKSTDGGANWSAANSGMTSTIVNALAIGSSAVYAGTAGGVFKSTDGGATWNVVNNGLATADVKALAIPSTAQTYVFAGTNGGGVFMSTDGAVTWNAVNTGLAGNIVQAMAADPLAPKKIYAGTSGKGVAGMTVSPTATATPTALNFGSVNLNIPSVQSITLSNTGTTPLAISSLSISGTHSAMFAIAPNGANPCPSLPVNLSVGQSCTEEVTFTPATSTGLKTATLTIASDDVNTPTLVPLSGTGVIPPDSSITSPAGGAFLEGASCTVTGTATATGTTVQKAEVSINGGAWLPATGTTSWSYTWTLPADGNYTIRSRATDSTGNIQPAPASVSVTVNNLLPASSITDPANNAAIKGVSYLMTGTAADAGAGINKVEISTDSGTNWITAAGTTSWSHTWPLPANGTHTIMSRATDNADDLQATPTVITVIVDNAPPTSAISAPGSGAQINGAAYAITGTASDTGGSGLQKVDVSVDGGTTWQTAVGTTSWSFVWSLPNAFEPHTITTRATDKAGNVESAPPDVTVTVDNIPPTSSITAPPQYLQGVTYTIAGASSDTGLGVQKVQVSVDGGTPQILATGTTSWSYVWTLPTDGSYAIKSLATDNIGNVQATPSSVAVIVNNTPPTSAITAPANNAVINGAAYTMTGAAFDAGAGVQKVEISIDGGPWQLASLDVTNGTWSYVWTLPPLETAYAVQAKATDNEGDPQTAPTTISVTVDNTAPSSTIDSPVEGAQLNGITYTITGTAVDPATGAGPGSGLQRVEVSVDGGTTWQTASGTANWTYNWTLPITYSPRTIKSRAVDRGGNVQTLPHAVNVTVYNIPPVSTITAPAEGVHLRGNSVTITGTALDYGLGVQKVEVSFDNGQSWHDATGTTGWSYLWSLPADGPYTIISRATNLINNVQTTFYTINVTVDNTPPETTISAKPPLHSNTSSPSFGFTSGEAGSTFECKLDSGAFAPCTSPISFTGTADGSHTFAVRATDPAGNPDPVPASCTWTVDTVNPVITAINPADKATRIGVTSPVSITFSEAMDSTTLTNGAFTLDNGATGTVTYDPATGTAAFAAVPALNYTTTYTATITIGAKDLAGNAIGNAFTWSFSTDPDGDADGNGVVDLADALECLKIAVGRKIPAPDELRHGDVAPLENGKPATDGKIDVGDAVVILEKLVELAAW